MTRRQQLLDFAILGLLHDAPMHGYELRKHLNLTMGVFRALSYGTLYPALRGLVAGGSITESTDAGAVTAASRRPRIVYELTDRGAARFDELAKQTDPTVYEDELFELRMAFFGRTWTAPTDTWVATVPIGYGDGYSRLLSNRGTMLVRGRPFRIAGRVCMDQTMLDLGPRTDVVAGDEVVAIGRQGEAQITAWDVADLMGTIPYEVTCLLTRRVTRTYG